MRRRRRRLPFGRARFARLRRRSRYGTDVHASASLRFWYALRRDFRYSLRRRTVYLFWTLFNRASDRFRRRPQLLLFAGFALQIFQMVRKFRAVEVPTISLWPHERFHTRRRWRSGALTRLRHAMLRSPVVASACAAFVLQQPSWRRQIVKIVVFLSPFVRAVRNV